MTGEEPSSGSFFWCDGDVNLHEQLISWTCWCQDFHATTPRVEFYGIDGETFDISIHHLLQLTSHFDRALRRFAERSMGDIRDNPMAMMSDFDIESIRAAFTYALERTEPEGERSDVAKVLESYQIYYSGNPQNMTVDSFEDGDSGVLDSEEWDPVTQLFHNGRMYRRKWFYSSPEKSGWYYLCNGKKVCGCHGSVFVDKNGIISTVSGHLNECEEVASEDGSLCFEDAECLLSLRRYGMSENRSQSPSRAILDFLESNPQFTDNLAKYDIRSLLAIIGNRGTSPDEKNFPAYGVATNFVKMDVRLDSMHIMVLATDEMLEFANCVDWIMFDGTFKCVPKRFYQMVTILGRCIESQKFVPIIHFLLPNKTQSAYRAMLELLDTQIRFAYVTRITSDFEKGLQNEIQLWVSRNEIEASVQGCRFHFVQSIRKRMKQLYGRIIDKDLTKKRLLRLMGWLPFLRREIVENLLAELQRRKTGIEKFLKYFIQYWMGKFDEWSIDRTESTRATNNAIESYHSIIGERLGKHPNMRRFLRNLVIVDQERIRSSGERSEPQCQAMPVEEEILFQFQIVLEGMPMR